MLQAELAGVQVSTLRFFSVLNLQYLNSLRMIELGVFIDYKFQRCTFVPLYRMRKFEWVGDHNCCSRRACLLLRLECRSLSWRRTDISNKQKIGIELLFYFHLSEHS